MQKHPESKNKSLDKLLQESHLAAARGDFNSARNTLQEIIGMKPFHAEANAHLAWLLSHRGYYRAAFSHYLRLLTARPWIFQVYFRILQCFWFLLRRTFRRLSDNFSFFKPVHQIGEAFIYLLSSEITRLIELMQGKTPLFSKWMKHHHTVKRIASVNDFEYYKNWEMKFAWEAISKYKTASVLDMGSGRSGLPSFIASFGHKVTAVDLAWEDLATQTLLSNTLYSQNLTSSAGDFLQLPFRKNSFDAVTLISAIEHIPGDGDIETIKNLKALLRENGDLIITVPAGAAYSEQWTDFQIGHVYEESGSHNDAQGFLRVYDPQAIRDRFITPSAMKLVRLVYYGETSEWGWLGLGRNFTDHRGIIYPSQFLSPLGLLLCKELEEKDLPNAHWAVACIQLRK